MKRKYREAMRAAARERDERPDDTDDEALEALDWHEDWAHSHEAAQQSNADHHLEMMK